MELKKLNEVYSITDTTDGGWSTLGQVVIETTGAINISFSTRTSEGEYNHIGGANYNVPANNMEHINSSFSCGKEYLSTYKEYTETLMAEVLTELEAIKETEK